MNSGTTLDRKKTVNLFADFLVSKFGNNSRFEVIDVKNFIIILGETDKKEYVDFNNIKEEFLLIYDSVPSFNTIDLIKYDCNISYEPTYFTYYNTDRCIFDNNKINSFLNKTETYLNIHSVKSEFPHGYGLNCGRFEFYLGEYISNHIFNFTNSDEIKIFYDSREKVIEDFILKIELVNSVLPVDFVWGLLMDVFFTKDNLAQMREIIFNYDITLDTFDVLGSRPWLIKNKIHDLLPV